MDCWLWKVIYFYKDSIGQRHCDRRYWYIKKKQTILPFTNKVCQQQSQINYHHHPSPPLHRLPIQLPQLQLAYIHILIAISHMKRSLQLKQNKSAFNLRSFPSKQPIPKQSKLHLPPLQNHPNSDIQKTLIEIIAKMELFVNQHPGTISDMLNKCIHHLNSQLNTPPLTTQHLAHSLWFASQHRRTEPQDDGEWGVRSQVLNIKRGDVQKVEGRKLFQKMRSIKYEQVPLRDDQEVMAALRRRINELEEAYGALNKKMEQCKSHLQQKDKTITSLKERVEKREAENQRLTMANAQSLSKLEEIQILRKRGEKYRGRLMLMQEKWKRGEMQLRERQEEIKSMWQAYFSSNVCLL